MVLKLVGVPNFAFTQIVAAILLEKEVPFEMVNVDFEGGEHKSAGFLAKHPFGQVPYIDDDGFILYESRAIGRYIADKYANQGTKLIPSATDFEKRALFEQAASIEQNNFHPYALGAVAEIRYKPMEGIKSDPALFQEQINLLGQKLDVYEKILSKQKYLTGDEISLADLYHLPYATLLKEVGSDIMTSKPNVARWYKDITSRPSWQAVKDEVKGTA